MTTLRGTKWRLNEVIDWSLFNDGKVFTIDFIYERITYGLFNLYYSALGHNIEFYSLIDSSGVIPYEYDEWDEDFSRVIYITKSQSYQQNDVENADLIAWLTANATLITEPIIEQTIAEISFYDNANLTGLPVTTKYFDASNLISLNYTKNSVSDADSVSFEIASQNGSISMFDKDIYTFQQLQEEGYLSYNEVKIYKNGVEDAKMYLYSPQKDINSIQWQFTLSDLFGKYKEKQFLGIGYGARTARDCLNLILGSGNYNLVNVTANDPYLDVEIPNCYLLPDTMWNTLNKICAFALLQGYVVDGTPTFKRSL